MCLLGLCAGLLCGAASGDRGRLYPSPPTWWLRDAACIAHYESGGDVHDTDNPASRGLLQFERATWDSVGGHGDPAAASRGQQLWRGYLLWRRDGWAPWVTAPLCGL